MTDAARGVEFLLSAVAYVSADGVLNDDQYEYGTIGWPFLRALGRRVSGAEYRRKQPWPAGCRIARVAVGLLFNK